MSDVNFEENSGGLGGISPQGGGFYDAPKTPAMASLLIKWGLAKNASQANYILIGVTVISFLATIYVIFFSGPSPARPSSAYPAGNQLPPINAPEMPLSETEEIPLEEY